MSGFSVSKTERQLDEFLGALDEGEVYYGRILLSREHPHSKGEQLLVGCSVEFDGGDEIVLEYHYDVDSLPPGYREPLGSASMLPDEYFPRIHVDGYVASYYHIDDSRYSNGVRTSDGEIVYGVVHKLSSID